MKSLDFSERGYRTSLRSRMTRRAWYVVFGAERVPKGEKLFSEDLAQRIHTIYNDIDPVEISEILENYVHNKETT